MTGRRSPPAIRSAALRGSPVDARRPRAGGGPRDAAGSGRVALGPLLAVMAGDRYPAVRHLAWRSLRRLVAPDADPGTGLAADYDPSAERRGRAEAAGRGCAAALGHRPRRRGRSTRGHGVARPTSISRSANDAAALARSARVRLFLRRRAARAFRNWRAPAEPSRVGHALRFPRRQGCSTLVRFFAYGRDLSAQIWQVRPAQADGAGRDGRDLSGGRAATRASTSSASSRRSSPSSSDRAKAKRFLDEAKVVLRLSHANLVPTFDAGEIDGEFFIAMELVEGKDLREIWNRCVRTRTRIPLDVALHVGARDRARAGLRPQLRRPAPGPPRRRAAQHPAQLLRRGEADRLRSGAQRAQAGAHRARRGVRPRVVPRARAGARRGRRRPHRRLQPGHRAVGAADRPTSTCSSPTWIRRPRCRWCATRSRRRRRRKAPWITPALDTLLMRALAPAREDRFQSAEEMRQALSDVMAEVAPRADAERVAELRARPLRRRRSRKSATSARSLLAEAKLLRAAADAGPAWSTPPARAATPRRRRRASRWRRSIGPRCRSSAPAAPVVPGLAFPREEESLGVDFAGRVIDNRYRVLRKIGEGGMGHRLRRRARRDRQGRRDQDPAPALLDASRSWSNASGARRAPPRASATPTSST